MHSMLDSVLFARRRRGEIFPSKLMGLTANPDVTLPPNSTGTNIDMVAGSGGFGRQVAAIGDAVVAAQLLEISARFAALIEGAIAPGVAAAANPITIGVDDGTNVRALKSAGAAILGALSSAGALLTTRPGNWGIAHTPAAATQATITRTAGAAGVRHVATSISATIATVGNAQTAIQLNLRDGATGAGTILWSQTIVIPTNGLWQVSLSNLNIPGTAATAMTLEFSAAGVADSVESVSLTGYDTPAA